MKKTFSGLRVQQQVLQLSPVTLRGLAACLPGQLWRGAAIPGVKAAMEPWDAVLGANGLSSGAAFQLRAMPLGPVWAPGSCAQHCTLLLPTFLTCLLESPRICPSPWAGLGIPWPRRASVTTPLCSSGWVLWDWAVLGTHCPSPQHCPQLCAHLPSPHTCCCLTSCDLKCSWDTYEIRYGHEKSANQK